MTGHKFDVSIVRNKIVFFSFGMRSRSDEVLILTMTPSIFFVCVEGN